MPRPASDIPQRLIDAARTHFLAQGVDGASLRSIAQDAETSIGMIYYHYGTKDALFLAVVEEVYGGLLADLEEGLDPSRSPEARLMALFERFGRLTPKESDTVLIVLREALLSSERLRQVVERFWRGHLPLLMGTFIDGIGTGVFAPHPPFAMLVAVGGMAVFAQALRGRMSNEALPFPLPEREALAKALGEIALRGLSAGNSP